MNSLPARLFSLIAAYAIALQALLSAMTLATTLTTQLSNAPALAVICSALGTDQPVDHDRAPCTLHCLLMTGYGAAPCAPPGSSIVALVSPAGIRISLPQVPQTLGRATAKNPQNPRAPPLA